MKSRSRDDTILDLSWFHSCLGTVSNRSRHGLTLLFLLMLMLIWSYLIWSEVIWYDMTSSVQYSTVQFTLLQWSRPLCIWSNLCQNHHRYSVVQRKRDHIILYCTVLYCVNTIIYCGLWCADVNRSTHTTQLGDNTQGTVGCLPPLQNKSDNIITAFFGLSFRGHFFRTVGSLKCQRTQAHTHNTRHHTTHTIHHTQHTTHTPFTTQHTTQNTHNIQYRVR